MIRTRLCREGAWEAESPVVRDPAFPASRPVARRLALDVAEVIVRVQARRGSWLTCRSLYAPALRAFRSELCAGELLLATAKQGCRNSCDTNGAGALIVVHPLLLDGRGCRKNHSKRRCINWSWDTTMPGTTQTSI
jgi:hypothetical protein